MARQQTKGTCTLCKATFPKVSMTRHLAKCLTSHDASDAPSAGKAKQGKLFHLVAESPGDKRYWLHVEMPATATLGDLDAFLRRIWLECCGHLSAFRVVRKKPSARSFSMEEMLASFSDYGRDPNELDMEDRIGDVFAKETNLEYEYDFGSTTALAVKVVGEREGTVDKSNPVRLLARNEPPDIPCGDCGKAPATIIDMEDAWDESGWLCKKCARRPRLSEDEMTLPVVNSPRAGVCACTGN